MSDKNLSENVAKATEELREQRARNPNSYSQEAAVATLLQMQDPGEDEDEGSSGESNSEIWRLLPHLQSVPEATLKKLPLAAIFQLSNALAKSSKATEKMSINSRLALNAESIMKNPTHVAGGLDNRRTVLHEARFLGGACCSLTDVWLKGREVVGPKGPLPVSNYDLDAVGCGGSVTAKGWKEIHDPSSQELRIKQFYLPNVAGSSLSARKFTVGEGGEELCMGDSLKEISDLEGYRGALNAMREAMASALPWNRSVSAIVGFMSNSNFLQADLSNNPKRAAILAEFTDYILGRNGLNWENGHSFISTDEMAHIWSNWKGKRAALFTTKEKTDKKPAKQDKLRTDICKKFNFKNCPKQADKECVSFFGAKLRHVCNKFAPGGGICGKDHARLDH